MVNKWIIFVVILVSIITAVILTVFLWKSSDKSIADSPLKTNSVSTVDLIAKDTCSSSTGCTASINFPIEFYKCSDNYEYDCVASEQQVISSVSFSPVLVTVNIPVTLAKPTLNSGSAKCQITVYNNDIALYTISSDNLYNSPPVYKSQSQSEFIYAAPAAWVTGFVEDAPWMPGEQTLSFGFSTPDINHDSGYIEQFSARFQAYDQDNIPIVDCTISLAAGALCDPGCTHGNSCVLNQCVCGNSAVKCSGYDTCVDSTCCQPADFLAGLTGEISQFIPEQIYAVMTTPDSSGTTPSDPVYDEESTSVDVGKLHITTIHTYTHVQMSPYAGIPGYEFQVSDPTAICVNDNCGFVAETPSFSVVGSAISPPSSKQLSNGDGVVLTLDLSLDNFAFWGMVWGNSSDVVSEKSGTITFSGPAYVTIDEPVLTVSIAVSRKLVGNLLTVVSTNLTKNTGVTVHTTGIEWSGLNPAGADQIIKGSILDGLKDKLASKIQAQLNTFGVGMSFVSTEDLLGLIQQQISSFIAPENVARFMTEFIFPITYQTTIPVIGGITIAVDPSQTVELQQIPPVISNDGGVLTMAVQFTSGVTFSATQDSTGKNVCGLLGIIDCDQIPKNTVLKWEVSFDGNAMGKSYPLWLVLNSFEAVLPEGTDSTLVTDALNSPSIDAGISSNFDRVSSAFWACGGYN